MQRAVCVLASVVCGCGGVVNAELVYGLANSNAGRQLVSFDSAAPAGLETIGLLSGVVPGHTVQAIDFRPATGELYAVSANATSVQLYTVNTGTGSLSAVGGGFTTASASGELSIDFDPVADELRVVRPGGQNLRFNPATGSLVSIDQSLAWAPGDRYAGEFTGVSGIAYSNNVAGASSTTLYAFDMRFEVLAIVEPPNTGQMHSNNRPPEFVSQDDIGFDISGVTGIAYINYQSLITSAELFATINLNTGGRATVGQFPTNVNVVDIAVVVPTPPAIVSTAGLALLALSRRRSRPVVHPRG